MNSLNIKVNWGSYMDLLKVINCMDKKEWIEAINVADWPMPQSFERVWDHYKRFGLFESLCLLDEGNLNKLFDFAFDKQIKYLEGKK